MALQQNYKEMLRELFGVERSEAILHAYQLDPVRALRSNPYKPAALTEVFPGKVSPLNEDLWIPDNYAQTVTHPLHHAGCYYIQDPSATMPVVALQLEKTDQVLDLCAAPGGKSTYILSKIKEGFLLANEIDSKRNQKLVHNLERWGVEHCAVTQNSTAELASTLPNVFDKVLLDAPCSGEGLYRRMEHFASSFDLNRAHELAALQIQLLEDAYTCVKDGGIIVYSTCTLNRIENEDVVVSFLKNHPQCTLEYVALPHAQKGLEPLSDSVMRYDPSAIAEGHFIARIRVHKEESSHYLVFEDAKIKELDCKDRILSAYIRKQQETYFGLKTRGFLSSQYKALKFTYDGIAIGVDKGKFFDYYHGLSQSLSFSEDFDQYDLSLEEAYRYVYGHPVPSLQKGIHCVSYGQHSLGFGKGDGKRANNRYPKGLRNKFDTYSY